MVGEVACNSGRRRVNDMKYTQSLDLRDRGTEREWSESLHSLSCQLLSFYVTPSFFFVLPFVFIHLCFCISLCLPLCLGNLSLFNPSISVTFLRKNHRHVCAGLFLSLGMKVDFMVVSLYSERFPYKLCHICSPPGTYQRSGYVPISQVILYRCMASCLWSQICSIWFLFILFLLAVPSSSCQNENHSSAQVHSETWKCNMAEE